MKRKSFLGIFAAGLLSTVTLEANGFKHLIYKVPNRTGGRQGGGGNAPRRKRGGGSRVRRSGRGNRQTKKIVTEEKPIKIIGKLNYANGEFTISGNRIPLDIDGGMAFRIKKFTGSTVMLEGKKICKLNKTFIRAKFIKPINLKAL